jgi:hypothetical protein
MNHVEQKQPLASGGEDIEAPTDAASMKGTERTRAFAAEWLAQRAQMERAVAEYEALKSVQSTDRNTAVAEGPSN